MIEAFSPFFVNREEDEVPSHINLKSGEDKSCAQLLQHYQKNAGEVSVHYVVDVTGSVYQVVDPDFNLKNEEPGNITIALIEDPNWLDISGQLLSLQELLLNLCITYTIPINKIQTVLNYKLPMFDLLNSLGSQIMQQLISPVVAVDDDGDNDEDD